MATPLTGIPTPTYGPNVWSIIASMAAALEALAVVPFASEAARDAAIPNPTEGRVAYVNGNGLCVYLPTGWAYVALAEVTP